MQVKILSPFKVGQQVEYQKEIMFKGYELVVATIVAINGYKILLDNGDELNHIQLETGRAY